MRVLSNLELHAVGGGDVETQQVEVIGHPSDLGYWDRLSGGEKLAVISAGLALAVLVAPVAVAAAGADAAIVTAVTVVGRVTGVGMAGLIIDYNQANATKPGQPSRRVP
jgi:hypothetical protein